MSKQVQVAVAIIVRGQQVYITQRQQGQHLAGCWEFQGGKIQSGEPVEQALKRELHEEINLQFTACQAFDEITFSYPEKTVRLFFYLVTDLVNEPQPQEGQQGKWCAIADLEVAAFPEANQPVLLKLQQQFA